MISTSKLTASFAALVVLFLAGCLRVQESGGIEACLNDVAEVEIKAVKLKNRLDKDSAMYTTTSDLYDDVVISVRQYLNSIYIDALKPRGVVHETLEDYKATTAAQAVESFHAGVRPSIGVLELPDPVTIEMTRQFVFSVVEGVLELHNQLRRAAAEDLKRLLSRGEMFTFDGLSDARLDEKYSVVPGAGD